MGQLPAKESSSSSSHRHHPSDPSSASANNSTFPFASSSSHPQFPSTSSNKPALPPLNLPSSFDGGKFEPQGVYPSAAQDYNHRIVHLAILNRKLAPFYKGSDDEDTYQDKEENNECPICFLYYPSPLNLSRCCSQPICTECFVQIKRADPDHTNPPSTEPAACPFCMQEEFGITYIPPLSIREKLASEKSGKKINTNDIPTSTSSSIGIDGELSSGSAVLDEETGNHDNISTPTSPDGGKDSVKEKMRRKSFGPNDPEVVTIDQIRPDFMDKLHLAQAAIARRANRRLIMRQVGDRLIPIGVTSGRMGAELNSRSEGPGGAIILREGERWGRIPGSSGMGGIQSISDVAASLANLGGGMAAPAASSNSASRRGGNGESERERGGTRRRAELERYLQGLGQGADVEEMMMMEAMRLSLLEHEEQQRKQAEAEKAEKAAKAASEQNSTTSSTAAAPSSESQVAGPSSSTIESQSSKPTSSSKPTPPLPRTSSASSPGGSYLKSTPQTTTSSVAATASPQQPASTSSKPQNPAPTSTSTSSSAPPTSTSFNFLSSNTMAELAELIDEGNESRVTSSPQTRTGGDDEAISSPSSPSQVVEVPTSVSHSKSGSISAPAATSGSGSGFTFPLNQNQTSSGTNSPSNSQFGGASSPPPSTSRSPHPPSSPSFTTRRLNPNNPFRRGNQSGNNSPNHSRQNSNLSNGVDLMD